uniref:Uncharacterized protein n=1 Tax=Anguilla anguilla TaxID=7936 RepID=A0A0E9SAD5_ANGAN
MPDTAYGGNAMSELSRPKRKGPHVTLSSSF